MINRKESVLAMDIKTADVIIVGGGIMGSSTAYNLLKTEPNLVMTTEN